MHAIRLITAMLAAGLLAAAFPASAQSSDEAPSQAQLDELARAVERSESLRAVKTLQRRFAQLAQFGQWDLIGALFAPDGQFIFDGQIMPARNFTGGPAVAAFLRERYGEGREGPAPQSLSTMMIENPVVNLSTDGLSAKGRWNVLIFHGSGADARIEGGIFVNDYAMHGSEWMFASARYYPQLEGTYEQGWTNWGGGDLPVVPYHFDPDGAGVPIPPAIGAAPASGARLAELQVRVDRMADADRIRSLQAAFGYYQDEKMWDDVTDLFSADCAVEIGGQGVWRGKAGVRRWLESMGSADRRHGQLNDRVQFDVTVTIAPGGDEAWARGIELGMLGEADEEKGWWEIASFDNRFIKEDGVWKLHELRRFPIMKTDIFEGWGRSWIVEPAPEGVNAPDERFTVLATSPIPEFLLLSPTTNTVAAADVALTGHVAPATQAPSSLEEVHRRLDQVEAFDGIENVSAAFGYYLDDLMPRGYGRLMAENGFREAPFAGYYITRERIIAARDTGSVADMRPGISYHWRVQPVLQVSEDGRSAKGRFRLFQPRTGKKVGEAGEFYGASFWGGMYHDRFVLEEGIWKIWEITLDQPLIIPVGWKDGLWAKSKDPATESLNRSFNGGLFPPDISVRDLGRREEHFWGGPGETLQWPTIMPAWFSYTNPVSGREPEFYQPGCVPCSLRPDLKLEANGYQEPPDAPEANRSP